MKHVHVLFLVALSFSVSLSAQNRLEKWDTYAAKAAPFVELTEDSLSSKLHLRCENPGGERLHINIQSESAIFWSGVFTEKLVSKSFDLSQLEDGTYTLQVNRGQEKFRKTIQILTSTYTLRKQMIQ
jgi:hypothetical protein